jgi:drug/metabolite transporter (DMT)-like permease
MTLAVVFALAAAFSNAVNLLSQHSASTGTLLQQAALHVGPLSVSQPFLVITDPFASIILSVWLFDERFTNSPAKIAVAVVAFAVMAVGVTVLTRTAPQDQFGYENE